MLIHNFKKGKCTKTNRKVYGIFFLYGMEKWAVIVAGGAGLRMGNAIPKQFLVLYKKPVLWHTVQAFQQAFADVNIVLVVPQNHLQNETIQNLLSNKTIAVEGGETRFQSVKNGLQKVPNNAVVFVHDGVRCLVSPELIHNCFEQTLAKGNAIPVVAATDSLRIENSGSHSVLEREKIKLVQTPQTFLSTELKKAFEQPYQTSFTDEATVMEAAGKEVFLIEGEYENIKITRPIDLIIAEEIIRQRSSF